MALLELEGVEVVGECVVGGILEICELLVAVYGRMFVQSVMGVPESECTAIFCVADILTDFDGYTGLGYNS